MSRRVILILLGLVLAAGGGSGGWVLFAKRLEAGIHAWAEARRADGYGVEFASLAMSGYPLGWTAEIGQPMLTSRPGRPPWRWLGPDLSLDLEFFRPQGARVTFPGRHRLELPATSVEATAAMAQADIGFDGRGLMDRIDARFGDVELALDGGPQRLSVKSAVLEAGRVTIETAEHPAITAAARTRWQGVILPDGLAGPLGREIASLALDANLKGELPPGPPDLALAAWRDGGGTVEVLRLSLEWGPLMLEAGGSLTLDGELQPTGTMTARVRGLVETITAFEMEGALEQRAAAAARLVAAALSRPTGPGGAMEARLPVTLQDRTVMLGPVVLMKVPRLRWSDPWYQAP